MGAVYPRWRGEHSLIMKRQSPIPGLSPLARGTRKILCMNYGSAWFIPAGAGNTGLISMWISIWSVYPRWRGEHQGRYKTSEIDGGLSPLARGTRANLGLGDSATRFIPAGAGNTLIGSE